MSNNELYQCPYESACLCNMADPCLGCEEFRPIKPKEKDENNYVPGNKMPCKNCQQPNSVCLECSFNYESKLLTI